MAADIRRRHGNIYEKLRALNTAVDEHFRNIKVRMDYGELTRPTSSVYRAPKYVTVLCHNLDSEIICVRTDLNQCKDKPDICAAKEYLQLDGLVTDLENQLKVIKQKITKRFDIEDMTVKENVTVGQERKLSATPVDFCKHNFEINHYEPERLINEKPVKDDVDSIPDTCSTITLPKLDHINTTTKGTKPNMCFHAIQSPPIANNSSLVPSQHESSSSVLRNRRGILKRHNTVLTNKSSAPNIYSPLKFTSEGSQKLVSACDKPKKVTFSHNTKDSLAKDRLLLRQSSNLGYPFGSSFPALPPVPSRRRFVTNNPSMTNKLESTVNGNLFYQKERSWMC